MNNRILKNLYFLFFVILYLLILVVGLTWMFNDAIYYWYSESGLQTVVVFDYDVILVRDILNLILLILGPLSVGLGLALVLVVKEGE